MNFHATFYLRRLHSLCGLVALGGVLMEHIFTNSLVLVGPEVFNTAVAAIDMVPKPLWYAFEILGIGVPFLFHIIYGIYIALQANNNPQHYCYIRNWQFAVQRWTAWFVAAFLVWHIVYLRLMIHGSGIPITHDLLQGMFSNPIVFCIYTLAMIASFFHFFNGITTFCMTWGIAKGPRVQNVISILCMGGWGLASLVVLTFMGSYIIC